jgi:hypothetical protein
MQPTGCLEFLTYVRVKSAFFRSTSCMKVIVHSIEVFFFFFYFFFFLFFFLFMSNFIQVLDLNGLTMIIVSAKQT